MLILLLGLICKLYDKRVPSSSQLQPGVELIRRQREKREHSRGRGGVGMFHVKTRKCSSDAPVAPATRLQFLSDDMFAIYVLLSVCKAGFVQSRLICIVKVGSKKVNSQDTNYKHDWASHPPSLPPPPDKDGIAP